MAHLIDMSNRRANMAFVGDVPWHGLGFQMNPNEDLDAWRIRAGLNWKAERTPVLFQTPQDIATADKLFMLYRDDTHAPLSVVSDRYQVVQPSEVIDFYRDLTERHGFTMETAGSLRKGKIVWALAKTGEETRIRGNDVVRGYLLLSTSFDGTMATTARFTTVRVVCNNTLHIANSEGRAQVNVPHNAIFDASKAKIKLGVGDAFVKFTQEAQAMAERKVNDREAIEFFLNVYHNMKASEIVEKQAEKTTDKTIARLAEIFHRGPGADLLSAKNTVWGLLNAVTRDLDHEVRAHSTDNRLTSAWYGRGSRMKEKARELALALVA